MIAFLKTLVSLLRPPSNRPAPAAADAPPSPAPDLDTPLRHARESYLNIQEIIRFTDMKTAFLIAVALVLTLWTLLAPLAVLVASNFTPAHVPLLPPGRADRALMALFWFGGVACGFLAFINALMSLVARTPNTRGPFLSSPIFREMNSLYCVYDEQGFDAARRCVDALAPGFTPAAALEAYRRQLLVVGAILSNKIRFHRQAILCLALQAASALAALMFVAASLLARL